MDELIKKICKEILLLFKDVLGDAINTKSGTNLLDSNLDKQSSVHNQGTEVYKLMYNDYLQYIESGRKPFARKVPIQPLIDWMHRKHISNDNRVAWAIRESIYQVGIKPRPILSPLETLLDDRWDNVWSDDIFNEITKELNKIFDK